MLVGRRARERERGREGEIVCDRGSGGERRGEDASHCSVLEDADAKCDSNYCRHLTLSHPRVCSSDPLKR